jgi:two-component system, response regulator PdtaR
MTVKSDSPRILVVDDDRLVLSTLSIGLERAGFAILRASSGEEAVQICKQARPDLVMMDIRMPGISGLEAVRRIHALMEVPVIFLSAYDDIETVEKAIMQGGLGYLVKPVDVHQIVPEIRAALARATDLSQLKTTETQLNRALDSERHISIATGILMERRQLSAAEAFEFMRAQSRSNRRKLAEVAKEIVASTESVRNPMIHKAKNKLHS